MDWFVLALHFDFGAKCVGNETRAPDVGIGFRVIAYDYMDTAELLRKCELIADKPICVHVCRYAEELLAGRTRSDFVNYRA